jgi:hypothetical protein
VTADFTRLTLDSESDPARVMSNPQTRAFTSSTFGFDFLAIALCTFSAIFGNPIHSKSIPSSSFYTEAEPPFVHAMASSLHEAGVRNRRLPGTGWMFGKANQRYKDDITLQHRIADEVGCRRHMKT